MLKNKGKALTETSRSIFVENKDTIVEITIKDYKRWYRLARKINNDFPNIIYLTKKRTLKDRKERKLLTF